MAGEVTGHVHCDICDEDVPITGKAGAAMVLGIHKKNAHGIAGAHANRKGKPQTRRSPDSAPMPTGLDDEELPTPLSVVRDSAAEVRGGKRAPNADDLTRALGRAYGTVALFGWGWVVDSDPRFQTDEERDPVVASLAPTPSEAAATVKPLARALAQLEWVKQHGRQVVENIDALDTLYVVAEQVRRARAYIAERRAYEQQLATGGIQQIRPVPASGLDANVPPVAQQPAPGRADLGGIAPGTIVTYEMLHGGESAHGSFPDAAGEM